MGLNSLRAFDAGPLPLPHSTESILPEHGESMMRVLVISSAYPPMHAGEATNTYYLCRYLADRKLDVHLLTSQSNAGIADGRIKVHAIMRSWSWLDMLRIRAFIRHCSPDAVLLMYLGRLYGRHPMITFTSTISKKVLPGVPFVTRFENVLIGCDPAQTSLLSRAFRKLVMLWVGRSDVAYNSGTLLRDSDRVIVLCETHHSLLLEESSAVSTKTVIIPPPPNIRMCAVDSRTARQRGREKLGIGSDDFVVSFMGYIYPWKGIETLLQAFQIVRHRRSEVRLLLIGGTCDIDIHVGSAYINEMHELSRRLGVDDKTTWTGAFTLDSEEASVYLYASDVCVLPFVGGIQMNNSSLASIAAHGLPLIATRGERVETPFRDKENVLLCPPRDAEALATAMDSLIRNPELRERLSKGITRLARDWFSWERAVDRTIEALRATNAYAAPH